MQNWQRRDSFPRMSSEALHYNRTKVFVFERDFDLQDMLKWLEANNHLPFTAIAVYIISIYMLKNYMKSREPVVLTRTLFLWNIFLASGNAIVLLRVLPAFLYHLKVYGYHFSLCEIRCLSSVDFFWGWIFLFFKFVELGDTWFILLRKHNLIFLHTYHHVTVLLASWYIYRDLAAPIRVNIIFNAFVHGIMYTYYAARALKIRVPRWIAMFITSVQILQMVVGALVFTYVGISQFTGTPCNISKNLSYMIFSMFVSYLFLFVNYFYWTYVKPKSKKL